MRRTIVSAAIAATLLVAGGANAALQLEGNSGVFLNTLAYPIAESKYEVSAHNVDLGGIGDVATYSIAMGLKNNIEVGYTRLNSSVAAVSDQNLLVAKWQFIQENANTPAVSVWGIGRDLVDGDNSLDLGITATKIVSAGKYPVVLDFGVRSTKANALGLFGYAADRDILLEGAVAAVVNEKLTVATEFKQQLSSRVWRDIAVRYAAKSDLTIDAGWANMGPGLDSQYALAVTRSW